MMWIYTIGKYFGKPLSWINNNIFAQMCNAYYLCYVLPTLESQCFALQEGGRAVGLDNIRADDDFHVQGQSEPSTQDYT